MSMRSGRGFMNDLGTRQDPETARRVTHPSLVIASRCDGSVPFEHSADLTRLIPNAELFVSDALSHLIWFGGLPGAMNEAIGSFLE